MFFWSTLANTYRTLRGRKTPPIILRAWANGGDVCGWLMLPPSIVEDTEVLVQIQQPDGIWKSSALHSLTGTNTMGRFKLYPLLFCLNGSQHENDGSHARKLRDLCGPSDDLSISVDSSCSVSIRVLDPATS